MKSLLFFAIGIAIILTACNKEKKTSLSLTRPYYYFDMDFDGQRLSFEEDIDEPTPLQSLSTTFYPTKIISIVNSFTNKPLRSIITISLSFKDTITENDILSLKGRKLSMNPSDGYPYISLGLTSPDQKFYATYMKDIDYGPYEFIVDTVILSIPFQPLHEPKYIANSYLVRGRATFNFSKNFTATTIKDDTLYPATNTKFSIVAFAPQ